IGTEFERLNPCASPNKGTVPFRREARGEHAAGVARSNPGPVEGMVMARKYSEKSQGSVKQAMHKYKHGELKGGKGSHTKAKNRKQAIAIGLSEARKKGAKVPAKSSPRKK